MKILNDVVDFIGTDKLFHLLVAALAIALVSPLGWTAIAIATISVLVLEFIKEIFLDDEFSWEDVLYTIGGCVITLAVNILYI